MGAFDDYITSLDGKNDLDVVDVVKNLAELHKAEIDPVVSKVTSLEETLTAKDQEIVDAQKEITKQKAHNFDLDVQLNATKIDKTPDNESEITGATITPDDLFAR